MTDKKISPQQMKEYLACLGVETELDFEAERLYIIDVHVPNAEERQKFAEICAAWSN